MVFVTIRPSTLAAARAANALTKQARATQERIDSKGEVSSARVSLGKWINARKTQNEINSYDKMSGIIHYGKETVAQSIKTMDTMISILDEVESIARNYKTGTLTDSEKSDAEAQISLLQDKFVVALMDAYHKGINLKTADEYSPYNVAFSTNTDPFLQLIATSNNLEQFEAVDNSVFGSGKSFFSFTLSSASSVGIQKLIDYSNTRASWQSTANSKYKSIYDRINRTETAVNQLSSMKKLSLQQLIDANLDQEKAKLAALQAKQALAKQTLSVGNSLQANILNLFKT